MYQYHVICHVAIHTVTVTCYCCCYELWILNTVPWFWPQVHTTSTVTRYPLPFVHHLSSARISKAYPPFQAETYPAMYRSAPADEYLNFPDRGKWTQNRCASREPGVKKHCRATLGKRTQPCAERPCPGRWHRWMYDCVATSTFCRDGLMPVIMGDLNSERAIVPVVTRARIQVRRRRWPVSRRDGSQVKLLKSHGCTECFLSHELSTID